MCLKPCRNPVIFIINGSNEEKPTTALVYWKLLKKQKVLLQLKGFTWLDKSLKTAFLLWIWADFKWKTVEKRRQTRQDSCLTALLF